MRLFAITLLFALFAASSGRRRNSESDEEQEYIINFRYAKELRSRWADIANIRQELQERFSLRPRTHARFGTSLFLVVKGRSADRERMMHDMRDVRYSEPNYKIQAFDLHRGQRRSDVDVDDNDIEDDVCIVQDASRVWGLDRIDQRESLGWFGNEYSYSRTDDGTGVTVYVVDTGILTEHPEFEGRASWGFTTTGMDGDEDLNGHGTHVAGIIGSKQFGVAKNAKLVAVKVLAGDGFGDVSGILNGLSWVYNDVQTRGITGKYVINLSLGLDGISMSVNEAVAFLVNEGIPVIIAAGNDHKDACGYSPASVTQAITVGATDSLDRMSRFSNFGKCLDIFAPGSNILSTFINRFYSWRLSGTSQATPYVSGVVARYLSTRPDGDVTPPALVADWLYNMSTKDAVEFREDSETKSPNRFLYMPCHDPNDQWDFSLQSTDGATAATHNMNTFWMMITLAAALLKNCLVV